MLSDKIEWTEPLGYHSEHTANLRGHLPSYSTKVSFLQAHFTRICGETFNQMNSITYQSMHYS